MEVCEKDNTSKVEYAKNTEENLTTEAQCVAAITALGTLQNRTVGDKKSEEELKLFCEQLQSLTAFIRNHDLVRNMYNSTRELENKLQQNLWDLHFLMKEVRGVFANIQQLKTQQANVKKEIKFMKKALVKQRHQETHEMELVVAVYDKELLRKWHIAKKSSQPQILESFLNDAYGKKEAVGYVCKMAQDKLNNMRRERNSMKLLQSMFTSPFATKTGKEIVKADDYSIFRFGKPS